MRAVIVGTGRIGCGYLAPLFAEAGWEVVLAARTTATARRIDSAGGFDAVEIADDGSRRVRPLRSIRAVPLTDPAMRDAVQRADLVAVSVGVGNVVSVGAPLAQALSGRTRPLDVWVVENGDQARALCAAVESEASRLGVSLPPLGFAGGVASVAVARGGWNPGTVPEFVGDSTRTLALDTTGLLGTPPPLPGVTATDHYLLKLQEKLYVFNAGHAIAAYLGWLRRHSTIDQAILDPMLRPIVAGCMLESRRALVGTYPQLGSGVDDHVSEALQRFANPALADPVTRVGRDPLRKLRPGDRLLGPMNLVRQHSGALPAYFAVSAAGALLYRGSGDAQAEELGELLETQGVRSVLRSVAGLEPDDVLSTAIVSRYRRFVVGSAQTLFPPVHADELVPT